GHIADDRQRDPFVAQPVAERVADQEERQARREAEHQHLQRLGLEIGLQGATGLFRRSRHAHAAWMRSGSAVGKKMLNMSSSCAGSIGLVRKPSMPASLQARLPVSSASAVSATIGVRRAPAAVSKARIALVAAIPSMPGRWMSVSMMSKPPPCMA